MRSRWTAALAAFALLGFIPQVQASDDVEQRLQQMQDRLQQMEDRLQATDDELEAANERVEEQSELIESSGLADARGASSGLGCLMCELTIGGWVAASYFYNLNDPNDSDNFYDELNPGPDGGLAGTNQGLNGAFYPLHPDHNSFSLDQVWWEIEREVNEEHRAGFRTDFVYGKTATFLNGGGPSVRKGFQGDDGEALRDDSALYIHQAYVQYLAPFDLGDDSGVTFKFGKFATLLGTEVAGTVYNWQITRGNVWNLLEPIDHIGVLASTNLAGLEFALGGVNGFAPDDPDRNDEKSVIGRIGWAGETVSAAVNGIWGAENNGDDGDPRGTLNGYLRWDPSDRFGMWLNGDYVIFNDEGLGDWDDNGRAWGVALAGRYGITERTGFALRGEYVADQDHGLGFISEDDLDLNGFQDDIVGVRIWGVTATLDHLLTDHLMVRAEGRFDRIYKDDGDDGEFFQDNSYFDGLHKRQITVGLEVVYNFNKFHGE